MARLRISSALGKTGRGATQNSLAQNAGATASPEYHDSKMGVIGVPVEDLDDFSKSSKEEFGQFAAGQFFLAGGFWLAVERLITNGYKDELFLVSLIAVVAGAVLAYAAFRQLKRRKTRIDKLIANAQKKEAG